MTWRTWIPLALGVLALSTVAVAAYNSIRLDGENRALAEEVLERTKAADRELASGRRAPPLVEKYLPRALENGATPRSARLEQHGEMLQGGAWRPFTAVQHVSADPPGFVWDARVHFAPLVSARVVDLYSEGRGALRAKLFGTFTVADAGTSEMLDASELMRYLAEGPWLPTVLLPGDGLEWSVISNDTARATLTDDGTVVSLDFTFDEQGDIVRVEGHRPRGVEAGAADTGRWVGRFWNYQERDGARIPLNGEVGWVDDEGLQPYWRGTIDNIEFDPSASDT